MGSAEDGPSVGAQGAAEVEQTGFELTLKWDVDINSARGGLTGYATTLAPGCNFLLQWIWGGSSHGSSDKVPVTLWGDLS